MRTTVTLDRDVERLLRDDMHRSRRSFKESLNTAVRAALGRKAGLAPEKRFVVKARPMGLREAIDSTGLNRLADDLEADAVTATRPRRKRA